MINPSFPLEQQITLGFALAFGTSATFLHCKGRYRTALLLLTLAALVLRLWACFLDPFLSYWDEVFHAMVGKNMVGSPLTPMLYAEPDMPVTNNWSLMHIWLHKPPFFLWQIALSVGLFGPEPWAVRLPSAFWMTAYVPLVYRMASLLLSSEAETIRRHTAFGAALLLAFSYYAIELTAGAILTEHNDTIFFAMIALSWWGYLEFLHTRSYRWAVLIGLSSAAAILTKWYFGAIVFLPWTIQLLHRGAFREQARYWLVAVACAMVPAGAWLAHIFIRFPEQAAYEWSFKARHFGSPVDGHGGPWHYHLGVVHDMLCPLAWWTLLPALLLLVIGVRAAEKRWFIGSTVIATHVFFALAATKMVSYTLFLLPLYLIAVAYAIVRVACLVRPVKARTWVIGGSFAVLGATMLNIGRIEYRHTVHDPPAPAQLHNMQQYAALEAEKELVPLLGDPATTILFNMPGVFDVQFMFRHGYLCMRGIPAEDTVERLRRKGYTVKALQDGKDMSLFPPSLEVIPDSVFTYPAIARL